MNQTMGSVVYSQYQQSKGGDSMYIRRDPILGEIAFVRSSKLVCVVEKFHGKMVAEMDEDERQSTIEAMAQKLNQQGLEPDEYDNDPGYLTVSFDLPANWFDDENYTYRDSYIAVRERTVQEIVGGHRVDVFELGHEDFFA